MLVVGKSAKPNMHLLSDKGLDITPCQTALDALQILNQIPFKTILADLRMPGMDGMEFMAKIHEDFPEVVFILITEPEDVRYGLLAMIAGASDYIVAPLLPCKIKASCDRALKRKRLESAIVGSRARAQTFSLSSQSFGRS